MATGVEQQMRFRSSAALRASLSGGLLTGHIGGRHLFATRLTSGVVKLRLYSALETAPEVAAAFVVESSFQGAWAASS